MTINIMNWEIKVRDQLNAWKRNNNNNGTILKRLENFSRILGMRFLVKKKKKN